MPELPVHFTSEGLLPPGDYPLTLAQLQTSMLVYGPAGSLRSEHWDAHWRGELVKGLAVLAEQLWAVGVEGIYVNGSFVEDKDRPNDIDGYFECDVREFASGELARELNRLDPFKCWTWDPASRRSHRGYPKRQLPMWHAYRVELYPHYLGSVAGRDGHGNALEFPAWFRQRRSTGEPKGIVRVIRQGQGMV